MDRQRVLAELDAAVAASRPEERPGLIVELAARLAILGAGLAQASQPAPATADEYMDVKAGARFIAQRAGRHA
jgi:hypothetical protein